MVLLIKKYCTVRVKLQVVSSNMEVTRDFV